MARYISPAYQVTSFVNGAFIPVVGAKKYFYEPGTVTPKTIYSDSELTLTRANPVVSDAEGRYAVNIFLDGLYDEVQKDASDITMWGPFTIGDTTEGQFEIWVSSNTYDIPEIVLGSDDEYYRSLTDGNQGNDPTTSAANWELLSFGRVWNTNITYALGDSAYGSDGFLYISIAATNLANNPTTDSTKWRHGTRHAQFSVAAGAVDVITAVFSPVIPALVNGLEVRLRAAGANATTTPTFAPDGLAAKTIVMLGNNALAVGSIDGADHELILRFNSANDNWELLNPANGDASVTNAELAGHPFSAVSDVTGTWALIETWTPTATPDHDFTFDESLYSDVRIVVENVIPATDNTILQVRLGHTDGGTIISSATYFYEYREIGDTAFTAVSTSTRFDILAGVGTLANEGASGTIETVGMTSILGPKSIKSFMTGTNTAALRRTLEGHLNTALTTAFDTVQVGWLSGNFEATGTVYMYGLKKV